MPSCIPTMVSGQASESACRRRITSLAEGFIPHSCDQDTRLSLQPEAMLALARARLQTPYILSLRFRPDHGYLESELQERARRSTAAAKMDPYTLLVTLDNKGQASGDLYLDDGSSFAYRRGMYAHRLFEFKDGVLSNKALPDSPSRYSTDLVIERIIVVGLKHKAASYVAKNKDSGQGYTVEKGPVAQKAGVSQEALIVRKPDLPIAGDWSLQISVTK